MAFISLSRRFHCACAALLLYALRLRGVCTALPRRSGTVLTVFRQSRNKVSLICSLFVCFQEDPIISALASVCENEHAENV